MYTHVGIVLPTPTSLCLFLILKDLIKSRQLIITQATHLSCYPGILPMIQGRKPYSNLNALLQGRRPSSRGIREFRRYSRHPCSTLKNLPKFRSVETLYSGVRITEPCLLTADFSGVLSGVDVFFCSVSKTSVDALGDVSTGSAWLLRPFKVSTKSRIP